MQGEFRGDFTRDTFNKSKHFLRVLMQQGRVQLDADWNEQVSILLDRLQSLAMDVLGLHGGPQDNCGFEFIATEEQIERLSGVSDDEKTRLKKQLSSSYLIGKGNYYVEGLLCENEEYTSYNQQPDFTPEVGVDACKIQLNGGMYLAYLDVWERHITYIEDDDELKIGIREVALGGADTATRSKLVWQVKLKKIDADKDIQKFSEQIKKDKACFLNLLGKELLKPGNGKIKVRVTKSKSANNSSCVIPFISSHRGSGNQLYRVEILSVTAGDHEQTITFVWARENSSIVFPILTYSPSDSSAIALTLENLGRDNHHSLSEGNWVEIVDDDYVLQEHPRKLRKIDKIDLIERQVTLRGDGEYKALDKEKHPFLRCWDSGEINVKLSNTNGEWIALEDGIEVQFEDCLYQVGDYWLIPVRTATGDVEWPRKRNGNKLVPEAQVPHGVAHHYAPLAIISGNPEKVTVYDCRRNIGGKENNTPQPPEPKESTPQPPKPKKLEFNRVINASWHQDQVFEVSKLDKQEDSGNPSSTQIFGVNSQDLINLFINPKLGLVVEFQKPVRVDSLHKTSVFALAQTVNIFRGGYVAYILPMEIEPVEVKKREEKSIRLLRVKDLEESKFNLITEAESLKDKNAEFTQAVRLIVPEDWRQKEIFTQNGIENFTVILRGDWIINEEILFDNISSDLVNDFKNGKIPNSLHQQFQEKGISLSENAVIAKEKENQRWRLIDQNKIYVIRLQDSKLTISETYALDGNHIWPGVPERPSGNGSEGSDWISNIHIHIQS